ncbi:MAG: deoxyribose-phosphate aldolase [Rikenellaceae bacterium]
MKYTKEQVARLIDISAVRSDSSLDDVNKVIEAAKEYNLICLFALPSFVDYVVEKMEGYPSIEIGGVVGFPSGGDTTTMKLAQATELKAKGCTEIDMVMNIGKLKSGDFQYVREDIAQIKAAVAPLPLKVIIEVAVLTDDEIIEAAKIVRDGGADYVKTGTGWCGSTTLEHIKLIKQSVGESIKLKVAGGVRDLETLATMHQMGVARFGIGYKSVLDIMAKCDE